MKITLDLKKIICLKVTAQYLQLKNLLTQQKDFHSKSNFIWYSSKKDVKWYSNKDLNSATHEIQYLLEALLRTQHPSTVF